MDLIARPDAVLHFPNNLDIEINYAKTRSYVKCKSYDIKAMTQGYVWHQIVVLHHGKAVGANGRQMILDALFTVVQGEEFFPIAYRMGPKEDRFLVRQCKEALDKLFQENLCIKLCTGAYISLEVQLNVAAFKYGHISALNRIEEALNNLLSNMECYNGEDGILNLTKFAHRKDFVDIVLDLGNRAHFERICKAINRSEKFRKVNGIILRDNQLTTLAPLNIFGPIDFAVLDVRDNQLRSTSRLCRDLKEVKANEILLAGNPVVNSPKYLKCLESIAKNFKLIDGVPVENMSKDYTPLDYEVDVECDGYRIDWTNKDEIKKFERSKDWHAIMIPDMMEEFTKEEIFDFFFLTISPELSDVYPCYYKFTSGEHQFLVRTCYDQLYYLLENCGLQLKVPTLVAPQSPNEIDIKPEVQVGKTIAFYLRMNVSAFKHGQIEPAERIQKALERCFMDRTLNLENFQKTEGLENIIVNLSSPNILNRILTYAARRFPLNCIDLRLGQNKIINTSFARALTLMNNLKAIDLSNNWLHDLSNIRDLSMLNLKSLCLDGNPLCSKYTLAGSYVKEIRALWPNLQILDNTEITSMGCLRPQKNYLCDVNGYGFVEEFINTYFSRYDKAERAEMRGFYHPNALFTMTCHYIPAEANTENLKRISKYTKYARNIRRMEDLSRAYTTVHHGPIDITSVLMHLPKTTHDMLTFNTDTILFHKDMIVIVVTGVFMDNASNILEPDMLVAFSRTFCVVSVKHNVGILEHATTYQITNEQLSVFNPSATQRKNAFKYSICKDDSKDEPTLSDRKNMLAMLKMLTNLKSIWCARCLEAADWEFEKSLEKFTEMCQNNEIPDTAFY